MSTVETPEAPDDGSTTVTVEVPDTDQPAGDTEATDVAIGVAIGATAVTADQAADNAEQAEQAAEQAEDIADAALNVAGDAQQAAFDAKAEISETNRKLDVVGEGLATALDKLDSIAQAIETSLPGEQFPTEQMPEDTEPESTYWWNRKVFNRKDRDGA